MGSLQHIKSPDAYVRMMQTFMFRMPSAERDEACQEVRQHLQSLVEDFQAEGHSPQEAITLAVERFGNPFKVGRNIGDKWEANRRRQLEAANPALARQKKWMRFFFGLITASGVFFLMRVINGWLPLVLCSAVHGLLTGCLFPNVAGVNEQLYDRLGFGREESQPPAREAQMKLLKQLSRSRSLRTRIAALVCEWDIAYSRIREDLSPKPTALVWHPKAGFFLVLVLVALIHWCPVDPDAIFNRKLMIFMLVSLSTQDISRVLMNRWRQNRTA